MAHWKSVFSARYVSADECEVPITATVTSVKMEEVGVGEDKRAKPVLHFREGQSKACVMNKTRCRAMEDIAGSGDMAHWVGVTIRLSRGETRFQGKKVACIDIEAAPAAAPGSSDDSIPF